MEIPVHPFTHHPTSVWKEISKTQTFIQLSTKHPQSAAAYNEARVVCMSDTHSMQPYIEFDIPDGDILIHAGDFTKRGLLDEVVEFNKWLGSLPHKHKIVIAGNHELTFDPVTAGQTIKRIENTGMSGVDDLPVADNVVDAVQTPNIRDVLTNCTYIEDQLIEIWGLRIYGTPWQPAFGKWAFNCPRGAACLEKWNKIPSDIDILITHGPPLGHGDLCFTGVRAGCVELLTTIQKRVKPKYHVFGHIHEGYGVTSDGSVTYINASMCDIKYKPINPPIVFDGTLPPGVTKDE